MYPSAPDISGKTSIQIAAWEDPATDPGGFDPRSQYAETFWLPILGPSTLWLLRHVAQRFDTEPHGFELDIAESSSSLGIGSRGGKNSAFGRSINRIVSFSMGYTVDESTIAVRKVLPQLHTGQLRRLTPAAQRHHKQLIGSRVDTELEDERRATKVAFTLLRLGDSPDIVEQQLIVWGIQPAVARRAVDHAWADKARADAARADAQRNDWANAG